MQDDLLAYARRQDPRTSHDAAASVDVERLQGMILSALGPQIWLHTGLTTGEIADYIRVPRDSVSPRMKPLVDKGLVIDSGIRRAGPSGRACIVWKLK